MKNFVLVIFTILLSTGISIGQDTLKLNFQEAVKMGLDNNVTLRRENNNLEVSLANRREARALYAPGIGATIGMQKINGQQFNEVTGEAFRDNTDFANVGVGIRYAIFDGLNRLYTNKRYQSELESQQFLVNRTEQDIIYKIGSEFLQVLSPAGGAN